MCGLIIAAKLESHTMNIHGMKVQLDKSMLKATFLRHAEWGMFAFLFALALIYVANAWTPSSYALVLNSMGAEDIHPDFGQPRAIRTDEYSVQTPHFQMAVLGHLSETDQISFF